MMVGPVLAWDPKDAPIPAVVWDPCDAPMAVGSHIGGGPEGGCGTEGG